MIYYTLFNTYSVLILLEFYLNSRLTWEMVLIEHSS